MNATETKWKAIGWNKYILLPQLNEYITLLLIQPYARLCLYIVP
jgi:hypothetical protein